MKGVPNQVVVFYVKLGQVLCLLCLGCIQCFVFLLLVVSTSAVDCLEDWSSK